MESNRISGAAPSLGTVVFIRWNFSMPWGRSRTAVQDSCGVNERICKFVVEKMERETGIEPATSSLGSLHSTAELLPRGFANLTVWWSWISSINITHVDSSA
jgi:hypothetical protein